MLTESKGKWRLSKDALEREEKIKHLHEAIAYHQRKIEEYEWEMKFLEGKVKANEVTTEEPPF